MASGGSSGPSCTLREDFRQSEKGFSFQGRQTWGSALNPPVWPRHETLGKMLGVTDIPVKWGLGVRMLSICEALQYHKKDGDHCISL